MIPRTPIDITQISIRLLTLLRSHISMKIIPRQNKVLAV